LDLRGVEDQAAVGRKARAFVGVGVGNGGDRARAQVHDVQLEGAADARDVGHPAAVGTQRGRNVVVAREGHALDVAAAHGHFVNLRRAAAVAYEIDAAAVLGEDRLGVYARALDQAAWLAAVRVDEV